jgi:hypothetical protein
MDFKQAIAKLKTLEVEGVAELVSAVEGRIADLEADKFGVIGEKRNALAKATTYEQALLATAKALGVEGDIEAVIGNIEPTARAIASDASQLRTEKTALETRVSEAETKAIALERQGKLAQVAAATGANLAVLERLLGDKASELAIADDGVKLGDKPLREYVEADDALKPFAAALFPAIEKTPETPRLPSGSPKGEPPKEPDPVDGLIGRTYSGYKALVSPKS